MDTIYYGGPILTMESEGDSPEAVLVSKGLIKKVGTLKEVMDAGANVFVAGTSVFAGDIAENIKKFKEVFSIEI